MKVRLPNGTVINNVPDDISQEELKRVAISNGLAQESDFVTEETTPPSPTMGEGFLSTLAPIVSAVKDVALAGGQSVKETGVDESLPFAVGSAIVEDVSKAVTPTELVKTVVGGTGVPFFNAMTTAIGTVAGPTANVLGDMITSELQGKEITILDGDVTLKVDSRGNLQSEKPDTFTGNILPYILPLSSSAKIVSIPISSTKLSPFLKEAIVATTAGVMSDQLITDPWADNLADMLEDNLTEGSLKTLAGYLSTDDDDLEGERRMKLLGQDLFLSLPFLAGSGVMNMVKGMKTPVAQKAVKEGLESLDNKEVGELFSQVITEIKGQHKAVVTPVFDDSGKQVFTANGRPVYKPVLNEDGSFKTRESGKQLDLSGLDEIAETLGDTYGGVKKLQIDLTGIDDVANIGNITNPITSSPSYARANKDLAQIQAQSGSGFLPALTRLTRQIILPRGYWSDTLFESREASQQLHRQILERADNISNRMFKSMDSALREKADSLGLITNAEKRAEMSKFSDQVDQALGGDKDAYEALPTAVKAEVGLARDMFDALSTELIKSPNIHQGFKDDIAEGIGSYVKSSYKKYTDPKYVPEESAIKEYLDRTTNDLVANNPLMTLDEADSIAQAKMKNLLEGNGQEFNTYFNEASRINNAIYSRRKEIPDYVKNLLGRVNNPSDRVVLTAQKLAQAVSNDKFITDFLKQGEGSFVFKQPQGIYRTPISGTNSILDDDYFTTPELVTALQGRQSQWVDLSGDSLMARALRGAAALKGTSQASKTILSAVTHFKNAVGANLARAMNGSNPFANVKDSFSVVKNQVSGKGAKALDDLAEEYIGLGITNTNITARELSELLDTAISKPDGLPAFIADKVNKSLDATLKKFPNTRKKVDSLMKAPQSIYSGTDDLYKIAQYHSELDTLKKAFPDEAEETLKQMAATKVKDTMFNYDRVPNAIKRFRHVPFMGNFVSFNSEAIRIAVNATRTGWEEVLSGNPVLRDRGIKRLVGVTTVAGAGFTLLAETTSILGGFSSEEKKALRTVSATPFSRNPIVIPIRDSETGEIITADATTLDPFEPFREPAWTLVDSALKGSESNLRADEIIATTTLNVIKGLLQPYLEPSILGEAIQEVYTASQSEDGKSLSGKRIFSPGMTTWDKAASMLDVIWDVFEPGTITTIRKVFEQQANEIDKFSGKPTDPALAYLSLGGMNFKRYDPEKELQFDAGDYASSKRNMAKLSINYRTTPQEVLASYESINRDLYRYQKELYTQTQAKLTLGMSVAEASRILEDSGITPEERQAAITGKFRPYDISEALYLDIQEKVYHPSNTPDMTYGEFKREMSRKRSAYFNTNLQSFDIEDERELPKKGVTELRKPFAIGGLVDVPNAPMNPAARIDKMTGLPYNIQAGPASLPEEDPIRSLLSKGGLVKKEAISFGRKY